MTALENSYQPKAIEKSPDFENLDDSDRILRGGEHQTYFRGGEEKEGMTV